MNAAASSGGSPAFNDLNCPIWRVGRPRDRTK